MRSLSSFLFLLLTSALPLRAQQEDYGACVGPYAGSIVSNSSYTWYCLPGDGPEGVDCMVSGSPGEPWDSSTAELSATGPGLLSFQWKCSSAEGDWLSLEIQVPGGFAEVAGISGEQDWQRMEVFIPGGTTKVRWTYRNFANANDGEDSGRVAQVQWAAYPETYGVDYASWLNGLGLPATADRTVNGLRLDTCYMMGQAPDAAVPDGMLKPLLEPDSVRFRVPLSKTAQGYFRVEHSTSTGAWSHYGVRSRVVPGSDQGNSLVMEYTVPRAPGGRQFLRCHHSPWLVPPEGFAFIPEGTFLMSSPLTEYGRNAEDENYQHQVTLTRSFFLRKTETTYDEFVEVQTWARANGYPRLAVKNDTGTDEEMAHNGFTGESRDDSGPHPVVDVNWYETIKWLNAKSERDGLEPCYYVRLRTGAEEIFRQQEIATEVANSVSAFIFKREASGWRLPTEAEWEYACRAGTQTALYSGQELTVIGTNASLDPALDPLAWYRQNSGGGTHPVGRKQPNPFGLYDMYGNAGEWTWDLFSEILILQFPGNPEVDPPTWTPNGSIYRIYRGGGWLLSSAFNRSARRDWVIPFLQGGGQVGFRYCRTAK